MARDAEWMHNHPDHSDCDRMNADAHLRAMLQTLLAERFKLVAHRETQTETERSEYTYRQGLTIDELDDHGGARGQRRAGIVV